MESEKEYDSERVAVVSTALLSPKDSRRVADAIIRELPKITDEIGTVLANSLNGFAMHSFGDELCAGIKEAVRDAASKWDT